MTEFSKKDAADVVLIARRAPLQNMDEAKAVNELLERFIEFFESSIDAAPRSDEDGPV